jgi:multidrug efflux pump subunit AcrA (membrane-fusion protein)
MADIHDDIKRLERNLETGGPGAIDTVSDGIKDLRTRAKQYRWYQREQIETLLNRLSAKVSEMIPQYELQNRQKQAALSEQNSDFEKQQRRAQKEQEESQQRKEIRQEMSPRKNILKMAEYKVSKDMKNKQRELDSLRQRRQMSDIDQQIADERRQAEPRDPNEVSENPWKQKLMEAVTNGRFSKYTRPFAQGFTSATRGDLVNPDYKDEDDPNATRQDNDRAKVFNKNLKWYSKGDNAITAGGKGLGMLASSLGGHGLVSSLVGQGISAAAPHVWNMVKNKLANRNVDDQVRKETEERRYKPARDFAYDKFGTF